MKYGLLFAGLWGIALLMLAAPSAGDATEGPGQQAAAIGLGSTRVDDELPDSVRLALDDDDGRPLRSVSVDLGGSSHPEKLIPNEYLCGAGGCPWLLYDPQGDRIIGRIFASTIRILSESANGYRVLRADHGLGAGATSSRTYAFRGGAYEPKD